MENICSRVGKGGEERRGGGEKPDEKACSKNHMGEGRKRPEECGDCESSLGEPSEGYCRRPVRPYDQREKN